MPFADRDQVRLYWEQAGSGPPVLFVGGTGSDLRQRPGILDSPLTSSCTVLAYDHRDHGRSSTPPGPYAMADFADDAAAVLDAAGWTRCAVVGVSFGGMVAQELALRHPGRAERLVLACTSSGGAGGASYPLHELEELPEPERLRASLAVSDVRYDEAWQDANPADAAALLELAASRRGRVSPLQLQARRTHDTWDRLPAIAVPTLVMAGRHDGIAPLANSEALVARIPDARLAVFEGGHLFLLQDPKAFPALARFLV